MGDVHSELGKNDVPSNPFFLRDFPMSQIADKPLVSVIVPTFNSSTTIGRTLRSIASQSYRKLEIIAVHDGGSKDNTLEVLEDLRREMANLRIIKTRHIGRSAARNVGWMAAAGEIFFFADSDEIYMDDYVEVGVEKIISENAAGVTITGSSLADEDSVLGRIYMEVYSRLQKEKQRANTAKLNWAWIFKRDAIESVGGYDEDLDQAEDKDIFIRIRGNGGKFAVVLGDHWHHLRPSKMSTYLRKTWDGSKRRVRFSMKHNHKKEMLINLAPSIAVILYLASVAISLTIFAYITLVGFLILSTGAAYKWIKWSSVTEWRLTGLFVLLMILTRIVTSFGYLYGFAVVTLGGIRGPNQRTASQILDQPQVH